MPPPNLAQIAARTDFVFDIETVPDTALCRKVYGAPEMSDDEAIAAALAGLGREPDGILPQAFHRPIVVAALTLDYRRQQVKPLLLVEGQSKAPNEEALLTAFWRALDTDAHDDAPRRIVSFNGKSFDMQVLEARSLQYDSIAAPAYFKPGAKYDTYRHKYSEDEHLDLLEYLPNYGNKAGYSLRTVAALVGLPGKDKIDGSQVYPVYKQGGIMQVAAYCLEDVIQTALIKIRLDRLRGILERDEAHRRIAWALDLVDAYLSEKIVPQQPAFAHTVEELRSRYRPALLGQSSDVNRQSPE